MGLRTIFAAILFAAFSVAKAGEIAATRPANALVEVRMLESGKPVAGVKVSWEDDKGLKGSGQTDTSGRLTIEGLPEKLAWLVVRTSYSGMAPLANYWNNKDANSLTTSGIPPFLFFLEKGARISGRVVDEAGKPITAAH